MTHHVTSSGFLQLFQNEGKEDLNYVLTDGQEFNQVDADEWPDPSGNEDPPAASVNIITNEIFNMIELLELLSVCCAGKSDIAELRC